MSHRQKTNRENWLSLLASTDTYTLEEIWQKLGIMESYTWIRGAETGAVMVRGRMGGTGARFNMGEMTVTRATVRFEDGAVGFGYTVGRAHRKAELVALLDAAFQRDPALAERVVPPMAEARAAAREEKSRKAAATKVDFFTLVRGEDPR